MRTKTRRGGFTVIEVMLFLAITGALSVAILIGSGAALGQSRYRDSVNSFKGLIQEQYGQIANVVSSDEEKPTCIQNGSTLDFSDDPEQARGTSDCVIMGRFLLVEPTKVTTYNVIGLPTTDTVGDSDVEALQNYALATTSPETHEVAWGATLKEPGETEDLKVAVLLLRSPLSGSILTYIEDDSSDLVGIIDDENGNHAPTSMINDDNMTQKDFCVDSNGRSGMTNRMAVRINARASNQSAIEIPLESEGVCD